MAFEHKDFTGSLFKNDKRDKDTHPHYKGTGKFNGQEIEIAAWLKDGANGKYMSLSIKPKQERTRSEPGPRPAPEPEFDDSIPF